MLFLSAFLSGDSKMYDLVKRKKKKKSQNYFSHPTALLVTMTIFGLPVLINRLISSITHSHGIYVHGLNMHIYINAHTNTHYVHM